MNEIPTKILIVDIDRPLPAIKSSREYARALVLLRLHEKPVGTLEVAIPPNGVDADALAEQIWDTFAPQIRVHLVKDDLSSPKKLTAAGIPSSPRSACLQTEDKLLETAPFMSVAIATRDRVGSLYECLRSILLQDYPSFEIIVVDNAPSSDEIEGFIKELDGKVRVRYVREDLPGLAIAHNRALTETDAPIVAFTDDDVIADKNWLRYIALAFLRDPKIACVTGMILPYELETLPQLWIEQFGGFSKGCERKLFDQDEHAPKDFLFPYSAGQFGSGANMAFRVDALTDVGGFDPTLGAGTLAKGGDDLAAFFNVIASGHRLVYEPAAFLYHKHRREYSGLARQAYGYGMGLSAFLTKIIWDNPSLIFEILLKVPAGLRYLLTPSSKKNRNKRKEYPTDLTHRELLGFLVGPVAYLRSRWHLRSLKDILPKVMQ